MSHDDSVAQVAAAAIEKTMAKGSTKDGRDDSWQDRPINFHLDRALRHAMTFKLIAEGNQAPDGERHLELAVTRIAMGLWIADQNRND